MFEELKSSASRARDKGMHAMDAGELPKADELLLASVLRFLSAAVGYRQFDEGVGLLVAETQTMMPRITTCLRSALALVDAGAVRGSELGGRYQYLVVAHTASLVGDHESETALAELLVHPSISSTPFWDMYGLSFRRFLRGDAISELPPSGPGEKYWLPYLALMKALQSKEGIADAVEEANRSFNGRNADKRFQGDAHQVEGSGHFPANWDFRLRAIR